MLEFDLLCKENLLKAQGRHGVDVVKSCNGYREEREDFKNGLITIFLNQSSQVPNKQIL